MLYLRKKGCLFYDKYTFSALVVVAAAAQYEIHDQWDLPSTLITIGSFLDMINAVPDLTLEERYIFESLKTAFGECQEDFECILEILLKNYGEDMVKEFFLRILKR